MTTQIIDPTPVDMSFVGEMMVARIASRATPDDTIVNFNQYMYELSDVTYSVDCSVIVSFANVDHSGDGWLNEPQPDIIDGYSILGLTVLKCLPDEQYRLNISASCLEEELQGPRLWADA